MNPHTGQTIEEVVTEQNPKFSVDEKQLHPTQSEDTIPDGSYQGKRSGDHTVLKEIEDVRSESEDEQDPPTSWAGI